jgi:type IV secretory pathway VirB2 component (pilin)
MKNLVLKTFNFLILQSLNPKAAKTLGVALVFMLATIQAQTTLEDCVKSQGFEGLVVFLYNALTGGFGALIMIVAGLGAILAAAFGQFKAALSALVVALGVFVLQIFIRAFFNVQFGTDDDCAFIDTGD